MNTINKTMIALGVAASMYSMNTVAEDKVEAKTISINKAEFKAYGIVDVFAGQLGNPITGKEQNRVQAHGLSPSYLGVSGKYKIDENLNLIGAVEGYFRPDEATLGRYSGDALFSKTGYIGVESKKYGQFAVGRVTTPYFLSTVMFDAAEGATSLAPTFLHTYKGDLLGAVAGDSSWKNSLSYKSPNFNGLSASLLYATGEQDKKSDGKAGFNVMYMKGPLGLTVSGYSVETVTEVQEGGGLAAGIFEKQDALMTGLRYDFGKFLFTAQYHKFKTDVIPGEIDSDLFTTGVAIPLTKKDKLILNYGITEASGVKEFERNTYSVILDHNITPTLDIYGSVLYDDVDTMKSGTTIVTGLRYKMNTRY